MATHRLRDGNWLILPGTGRTSLQFSSVQPIWFGLHCQSSAQAHTPQNQQKQNKHQPFTKAQALFGRVLNSKRASFDLLYLDRGYNLVLWIRKEANNIENHCVTAQTHTWHFHLVFCFVFFFFGDQCSCIIGISIKDDRKTVRSSRTKIATNGENPKIATTGKLFVTTSTPVTFCWIAAVTKMTPTCDK